MKQNIFRKYSGLAAAALLMGGTSLTFAQTPDLTISSFDTGTAANRFGTEWGPGSVAWDDVNGNPAGSLLVSSVFGGSDTPLTAWICLNGNPWYVGTAINFSQYKSLQFDIKWDNTSDITIAQFNSLSTWPVDLTNSLGQNVFTNGAPAGVLGGIGGLEINLCGGPGGQMSPVIFNTNIPAAAASGWTHVIVPINPTQANIDGVSGIVFHKWINNNSAIVNPATARFWVDNVMLEGTAAPPPPPTVRVPTKVTPGLNVFASTAGLYDRQSAVLRQTSGLSWVGQATAGNPVTYSFTIAGYPNSVNCEAYLFLIPNPAYLDGAPDWNETNCALAYIQGDANSATMHFQYKVNEPNQQAMYSGGNETRGYYTNAPGSWDGVTTNYLESGNLGSVTNNGVLGTWTIKFTSDTNVTLIAPNGNSTNFIFPAYNVGLFAEQTSPGFYVYLGMQANNADALSQAVVYSSFAISNTASPFSENFLADSVLDTTNTWNTSAASGPKGVLIVPADSASWVSWTLPDSGFGLEISPTLSALAWTSPTTGPIVPLTSTRSQLVASNELPVGSTAFFRLIKRTFTKLQILLPGETAAPGTLTGKTGTPTAQQAGVPFDIVVNAVDDTWHPIAGVTHSISLSSTDTTFNWPGVDGNMVNGKVTFDAATWILAFGQAGSYTITATDTTDGTKTPDTSPSVTVTTP